MERNGKTVCVTGAGGFIGSWLVKLLIARSYNVHATLRNPGDSKNVHLQNMGDAAEKLKLFQSDLLNFDSVFAAIDGCDGVFHVASPVPSSSVDNPEVQVVEPSVKGTLTVLKACSKAKVRRVVFVSSVAAVGFNPNFPKDRVFDETCWSDREYCKMTNNWYYYSKTVAESEAVEYGKTTGLDVITFCPTLVLGPMLQKIPNASSLVLIKFLKEGFSELENIVRSIVDVRDVGEALILVYEAAEAEGRYICRAHSVLSQDLMELLRPFYPNYNYPKSFKEGTSLSKFSSEKLQKLGWRFRSLQETLIDSVENYKERSILD